MKRFLILLVSLLVTVPAVAQSRGEALLEYQARRKQAYTEYQENNRAAYSDYLRKRWEAYSSYSPIPVPQRKEPVVPVTKKPDAPATPTQNQIRYNKIVEQPKEESPEPQPPKPEPEPEGEPATKVDSSRAHRFTFYGTGCSVSLGAEHRFGLASLQENSVADAWDVVSGGLYDAVARECAELKTELNLNDWGYYELVRTVGDTFYGKNSGESVVLRAFLMADAGYKVRLARGGDNLHLLLVIGSKVYERPYFKIDGQTFYLLDNVQKGKTYQVCNVGLRGERPLSFRMVEPPRFAQKRASVAVRKTKDKKLSTKVAVNQNLIDFYANYPPCDWSIYAVTRLDASTRGQLFPELREAIAQKSELDAANLLLHYLHEAFPYETDAAQFGRERTLFAEEMYYYPDSDCEDRSILFAMLVRELLGLDAVLLYYPNHIAAAVCFNDSVAGDYVKLGAKKYVICDPTYLGADVGEAIPDTKGMSLQIVKID